MATKPETEIEVCASCEESGGEFTRCESCDDLMHYDCTSEDDENGRYCETCVCAAWERNHGEGIWTPL